MGDEDRAISHATGELREYAEVLDGYHDKLLGLVETMADDKVTPEMWGVHDSAIVLPANPNATEPSPFGYLTPQAPQELILFKVAYEAAHEALATRLQKIAEAFEEDARKYRLIADHYDEDERENLAELDSFTVETTLP